MVTRVIHYEIFSVAPLIVDRPYLNVYHGGKWPGIDQ